MSSPSTCLYSLSWLFVYTYRLLFFSSFVFASFRSYQHVPLAKISNICFISGLELVTAGTGTRIFRVCSQVAVSGLKQVFYLMLMFIHGGLVPI